MAIKINAIKRNKEAIDKFFQAKKMSENVEKVGWDSAESSMKLKLDTSEAQAQIDALHADVDRLENRLIEISDFAQNIKETVPPVPELTNNETDNKQIIKMFVIILIVTFADIVSLYIVLAWSGQMSWDLFWKLIFLVATSFWLTAIKDLANKIISRIQNKNKKN